MNPQGAYPKNLNRHIHGLRGFSTLAVFVYHVYGMGTLWNFWPASLDPVAPFFAAGKHGVEIFFIISGYLITGSLIRHQSAAKFLVDRAIRLYPVFMTIQLIVFGLGPVIHYKWLSGISPSGWAVAFVENGLFLPGIFDLPLAQLNAWSLSYEAAFYLLSAASYVLARHVGRRPVIAVLVILAAILVVFASQHAALAAGAVHTGADCHARHADGVGDGRGPDLCGGDPGLSLLPLRGRRAVPAVRGAQDPLPAISRHDELQLLSVVAGRNLSDEARDPALPARTAGRPRDRRTVRDHRLRRLGRGGACELSGAGGRGGPLAASPGGNAADCRGDGLS
jgi:hypothetical protein